MVRLLGSHAVALFTACSLLSACDASQRPQSTKTDVSSAPISATPRVVDGITMLEHQPNALDRAPRISIDTVPIAVIDGNAVEPGFELARTGNPLLLSDGRLAILNPEGAKLLIFGADGRALSAIGQRGSGPRDFGMPFSMVAIAGDTLIIVDIPLRRLTYALPNTGPVAITPIPSLSVNEFTSRIAGRLRNGTIVLHHGGALTDGAGKPNAIVRNETPVVMLDSAEIHSVTRIKDLEVAVVPSRFKGQSLMSTTPIRLTRRARVVVWDSLVATSDEEEYRIDLRAQDGRIIAAIKVPITRRATTPAIREAVIAADLQQANALVAARLTADSIEYRRKARENPISDSLPFFSHEGGFFTTPHDILWVVDVILPGDSTWTATAFRQDGAILGRLQGRGPGSPVAFSNDRVAVLSKDEDGNPTIKVYKFTPPSLK
jgi:hypothetical protein